MEHKHYCIDEHISSIERFTKNVMKSFVGDTIDCNSSTHELLRKITNLIDEFKHSR